MRVLILTGLLLVSPALGIDPELAQIKNDEGLRLVRYKDSLGLPTIGYGRHRADLPLVISPNTAEEWLIEDVAEARECAKSLAPNIHPEAENILTNMAYNMGCPRLSGFDRMLEAVNEENYVKAAKEMENSRWYFQVGNRSKRLVDRMLDVGYCNYSGQFDETSSKWN